MKVLSGLLFRVVICLCSIYFASAEHDEKFSKLSAWDDKNISHKDISSDIKVLHKATDVSLMPSPAEQDSFTRSEVKIIKSRTYIIAGCSNGLSNRLRNLAAHIFLAKHVFNNSILVFAWDINQHCTGHYLDLFRPLEDVIFVTNHTHHTESLNLADIYQSQARIVHISPESYLSFPAILAAHNALNKTSEATRNISIQARISHLEIEQYNRFIPKQSIFFEVEKFSQKRNICDSAALHIRRTDILPLRLKYHTYTTRKDYFDMSRYFRYVESRPANQSVFLMTDNRATQIQFLSKYGSSKILIYQNISMMNVEQENSLDSRSPTSSGGHIRNETKHLKPKDHVPNGAEHADNKTRNLRVTPYRMLKAVKHTHTKSSNLHAPILRFTTLEHTLIDVLIAARAESFQPDLLSSLSDLTTILRQSKIGRLACALSSVLETVS